MLISHALVLGLTLLLVAGLAVAVNVMQEGTGQNIRISQSQFLCERLSAEIASMYHSTNYEGSYDSYSKLQMPEKIGGKSYSITAQGRRIVFAGENSEKTAECFSPVDLSGNAQGGFVMIIFDASQGAATIEGM